MLFPFISKQQNSRINIIVGLCYNWPKLGESDRIHTTDLGAVRQLSDPLTDVLGVLWTQSQRPNVATVRKRRLCCHTLTSEYVFLSNVKQDQQRAPGKRMVLSRMRTADCSTRVIRSSSRLFHRCTNAGAHWRVRVDRTRP